MAHDSLGAKGQPQYATSGAPSDAADLTEVAQFAADRAGESVAALANLPMSGNWDGRVITTTSDKTLHIWVGTGWVTPVQPLTPWANLTLGSGWTNQSGYAPLRYRINQIGDVEVQGQILPRPGYPNAEVFATLPAGARPAYKLEVPVVGNNTATRVVGGVLIDTNGNMNVTQDALGAFSIANIVFSTL
jgi:hypothetical protein